MCSSTSSTELPAGRVGRAHGLDGSFYVTGPVPRLLVLGTNVSVGGRSAEIVRRAGTDQHPIVRLQGIGDRTGAEGLRGEQLTVLVAEAPRLGEGEWWAHELEGCEVRDGERAFGRVVGLLELPSCEALEVRREPGGEAMLVPMVGDAIREIDAAARRIEIDAEFLGLEAEDGA
ncbi:MAG TPA: ribosome maturation factor RimM [Solirubrobacteraceae bacterium]|jgi:16S rRNA processing protein RimM|nr:ribosome maturation factor RimM [Solirubrobacteraceae bacterium]